MSRKNAVPAIFADSGEGDPEKNFGDWLLNVAIVGSKNGKRATEAQDRLEKEYGSMFSIWQKPLSANRPASPAATSSRPTLAISFPNSVWERRPGNSVSGVERPIAELR